LSEQTCYTVSSDVGTNLDKAIEVDIEIATWKDFEEETYDDDAKVTVTHSVSLKTGSGLLLWLFIILLLGGGGGAAYYFMVLAPTM